MQSKQPSLAMIMIHPVDPETEKLRTNEEMQTQASRKVTYLTFVCFQIFPFAFLLLLSWRRSQSLVFHHPVDTSIHGSHPGQAITLHSRSHWKWDFYRIPNGITSGGKCLPTSYASGEVQNCDFGRPRCGKDVAAHPFHVRVFRRKLPQHSWN